MATERREAEKTGQKGTPALTQRQREMKKRGKERTWCPPATPPPSRYLRPSFQLVGVEWGGVVLGGAHIRIPSTHRLLGFHGKAGVGQGPVEYGGG